VNLPTTVHVGGRAIGVGHPCFVVAEIGVNHDGEVDKARGLIDAAVSAGADAVKFQMFHAADLAARDAPLAVYQAAGRHASQLEMLEALELTDDELGALKTHCAEVGITPLATPFDERSVRLLVDLGFPAVKIASGDLTYDAFLEAVGATQRPVILSTGMTTLNQVRHAVDVLHGAGASDLVLLHCTSAYPAEPRAANLRAMDTMRDEFAVPIGYSDHTLGIDVALAATALGADVIEKHITLDTTASGPDHAASVEPDVFERLVKGIRTVESSLGSGRKEPTESERDIALVARRSLFARRNLPEGHVIGPDDLTARRPGTGLAPSERERVIGRVVAVPIAEGTLIEMSALE
jgi:sialic acid synthase SpsE